MTPLTNKSLLPRFLGQISLRTCKAIRRTLGAVIPGARRVVDVIWDNRMRMSVTLLYTLWCASNVILVVLAIYYFIVF